MPRMERLRLVSGYPIDCVLEQPRHGGVILRGRNNEGVVGLDAATELLRAGRKAVGPLDILIVGGRIEVLH